MHRSIYLRTESGDSNSGSDDDDQSGDGVGVANIGGTSRGIPEEDVDMEERNKSKGQLFASASEAKLSIWKFATAN